MDLKNINFCNKIKIYLNHYLASSIKITLFFYRKKDSQKKRIIIKFRKKSVKNYIFISNGTSLNQIEKNTN